MISFTRLPLFSRATLKRLGSLGTRLAKTVRSTSDTSQNAGKVIKIACNGFAVLTSDDVTYLRYTESILEDYGITGMPVN